MICPETGKSFFDEQLPGNRLITTIKGAVFVPILLTIDATDKWL